MLFFSTFPNENKTVFLCAVQMVPSCSLTILFLLFFFFFNYRKNPEEKRWVDISSGRTFEFRIYLEA